MNFDFNEIDFHKDKWIIPNENPHLPNYTFIFQHCPNNWFKHTIKNITLENMKMKKIKISSICRYIIALQKFYDFLISNKINMNNLSDLQNNHIEMLIFHLQQSDVSKSSISTVLASLKWLLKHGKQFGYEGFPKHEVFSGEEFKMLKIEDTLKTKTISKYIMSQIEKALKNENDILLKSILEIGIDTGLRLNECLSLTTSSLSYDFTDKPILHVVSEKNSSERFIPVSNRVKKAVQNLINLSDESRGFLRTDCITVFKDNKTNNHIFLKQQRFRDFLSKFVKTCNIVNENGELYNLNYHSFRHTLGTSMINKGMSIFEIQDYLGHESLHSTSIYAKIENPTLHKKYKEIGFIGKIIEEPKNLIIDQAEEEQIDTLHTASLPDGICSKPIDNEGKICAKYNMCLLCPKFITTPNHLEIHKNHLERIRNDKQQYMTEEYIGSLEHLEKIEYTLETIISQLEEMKHVK